MTNPNDPDAYKSMHYILSGHTDLNLKGDKKKLFAVSTRMKGENSVGAVYERKEIPYLLARQLLKQSLGRFTYDSISLTMNNANENTISKEIYDAMLQTSPSILLQRGIARIRAFGEEEKFLEDLAEETFRVLERSLGKETLQRLAPEVPGTYNHCLLPTRPVPAIIGN